MSRMSRSSLVLGVSLLLAFSAYGQEVTPDAVASAVETAMTKSLSIKGILDAAKTLFWSLAVISLVWTMGMLVLRQDLGEVLLELVRFVVVTGTFYWLLVNASDGEGGDGFIADIVDSFFELGDGLGDGMGVSRFHAHADAFVARGLRIYFSTLDATRAGSDADQLLAGGIAILILVLLTIVAAQFLVALVTAWLLGYAGIFLLGFGGARWTSALAISYYKHALAVGISVLMLGLLGAGGHRVIESLSTASMNASDPRFMWLGMMLSVSVLVLVLAVRVPQFFYTLVTGSHLGVLAGSAGVIGSAIATGGVAAFTAATGRAGGAAYGGAPLDVPGGSPGARATSVMDAVQRSSALGRDETPP
jgi:type IV secretion system protein VirB6/type IV secretion system protein TrbL